MNRCKICLYPKFEDADCIYGYNSDTGDIYWKVNRYAKLKSGNIILKAEAGKVAGTQHNAGYRTVIINNKSYLSHRIAWLLFYGNFPKNQIDHINGIKDDNRIKNLREATHLQNSWNRGMQINNTSGHKGVYFDKRDNSWYSKIQVNGQCIYLGYFKNKESAILAYEKASNEFHGEYRKSYD